MLYPNKTGALFRYLMPSCTWQVKTDQRRIYLTFDDGPIPDVTEWVLDVLQSYAAKATFFCVGDNIRKHPHLLKRIVSEGHAVGNHTFHHLKGWKTKNTDYYANIQRWEDTVKQTGITLPNKPLFRPPYGQISFRQAKHLRQHYQIIMWDIITGDFDKTLDKENCLQQSIQMTQPGTVIVFHDSIKSKDNVQAILPRYLEAMKIKGFEFSLF